MRFRAREGDFIESSDGLIFDVKGMVHPPNRVIAFLRYFPDKNGFRERSGVNYRKVYNLSARAKLLRKRWPEYLYHDRIFNRELQAVPFAKVERYYAPSIKLRQLLHADTLDNQQRLVVGMARTLANEARVPIMKIGVSGSILVDLHNSKSDIDLILYGAKTAWMCHLTLQTMLSRGCHDFKRYGKSDLRKLYLRRKQRASMPFDTFLRHERCKSLQGKFRSHDYFIRCVRDWREWRESYGVKRYFPVCRSTVRGTVSDDTESILTPCIYKMVDARAVGDHRPAVTRIVSYRGRFCEQVHTGEQVHARGTLERVLTSCGENYRLVIGEHPSDFLTSDQREHLER